MKTLESFDFTALPDPPKPEALALAQGDFIKRKENVICLGNSGTGKTHIAIALGISAISAGYRVRFIPVMNLVVGSVIDPLNPGGLLVLAESGRVYVPGGDSV